MVELKLYAQNYWHVADVFKDGEKIASINQFYEVQQDWIIIYGTQGGSGYGYKKGEIIQKIFIGDSEFITTSEK